MGLADQLLKAGLVDKKKVKVVHQTKGKQEKDNRRAGIEVVEEVKLAAQEQQRQAAEKARLANAERDAVAQQKAIAAQITQMVQQNKQSKDDKGRNGDIAYNFTFGTRIERIYVSAAVREHLVAGRLVIVGAGSGYELVPRVIADKIAERNPDILVRVKQASTEVEEDDPYADFKIPDDLMW